ncbi:tRNA pseudouridine(55) synthase TruB [Gemella sp. GH3]|uniref:tRNA pseudouridine(55) synthase TruB n=1 Tax=unclassified Gemella TaxID=2624949 RepID=UPI0015D038D7|nr:MULTISPECIES: tRNA pseudouridine(55) synthase TruB [unclassified Gemella]MBF0713875.1 tRNA pseudouridine(55) synthase TruB [Gemella sp. GH3.1]NYS50827.1 tRNA pseudouridine(55) synthase TruB [Gemella sp. GH3]
MYNGILPVYKNRGMTSHDVVFKLRKILNMKKVGHSGTLDPDVDGVLLILLGDSTKVSDYAMDLGKGYRAEVCLGIKTTTEDLSGDILENVNIENISLDKIKKVCDSLVGNIIQKPPIYSAIKVNGKKLYEYARMGNFDIEIPTREVTVYSINILENSFYKKDGKLYFTIDIKCGKGTYIRTLATQIGEMLNVPSCMSKLTRTSSGKITIDDTLTLGEIENLGSEITTKLLPKEYALEKFVSYEVPKFRAKQIMNGLRFRKDQFPTLDFSKGVVFTYNNEAIAVYILKNLEDDLLSVKTTFPKKIE